MALGMFSRAIDTASWARPLFGLFVLPWLLAAWLAGAWLARPNGNLAWGAVGGLVLLAATTAAYLAAAGGDAASTMAFRLTVLAVVAGPLFGLAGAAVHHGPGGRQLAVLALLAAVVGQAALLTFIGPVPGGAGY